MRACLQLALVTAAGSCCEPRHEGGPDSSSSSDESRVRVALDDLRVIDLGAARGSQAPNLHVGLDGAVVATWLEPRDDARVALEIRVLREGRWSSSSTVIEHERMFVNWADVPAAVGDGRGQIVAAWLEHPAGGSGYEVRWARSADAAASWSVAQSLSDHTGGPEYGFVSFGGTPDDELEVFWLDGRASSGHHGGQMQLWGAVIDAEGAVSDRRALDERVCDCCQTAAARTSAGSVVAYRDRSESEIRDIVLAGPGRGQVRLVSADEWRIEGCPVNGPAVSVLDDRIAVAWFTAAADAPRVRVAFASIDGPFSAPIRVDLGRPVGRVDVAWTPSGDVVVSHLERGDDSSTADLVVRRVSPDGRVGAPASIARTSAAPSSGFPRMARIDDRLLWAWTQVDDDGTQTVRFAEAPVAALPTLAG